MAYADRWPRGEALRRHRLWSRRQECTWLALRLWEGPHCHHTRTSVVLCCRHGHHPAAALPDAGRKQASPPPSPSASRFRRPSPEGRLGAVSHLEVQWGGAEKGHPAALGAPARQLPSPPSGPSCENLTTDTEVRVDGEPAGTGVWDTSLSFCTGCGEWREWGEQPESFSEAGHMSPG